MTKSHPTGIDAYKPNEIAVLVRRIGSDKARLPILVKFTLSVLAGLFIGLGALSFTVVMTGADPAFGPARLLGGVVFSLGLILVVIAGAELFTGNVLMVLAAVDRLVSLRELLSSWVVVYAGNFVGAFGLAVAVALSGILDGPSGLVATSIAASKLSIGWLEAFVLGALCNMLVCLAVWLSLSAHAVAGKILAIVWPISCFVLLGLEHSIANMYLIPQGFFAGAPTDVIGFARNLVFVTLGNIVGGAGGVALAYRLAFGPPDRQSENGKP